jgi:hypothetical protein
VENNFLNVGTGLAFAYAGIDFSFCKRVNSRFKARSSFKSEFARSVALTLNSLARPVSSSMKIRHMYHGEERRKVRNGGDSRSAKKQEEGESRLVLNENSECSISKWLS